MQGKLTHSHTDKQKKAQAMSDTNQLLGVSGNNARKNDRLTDRQTDRQTDRRVDDLTMERQDDFEFFEADKSETLLKHILLTKTILRLVFQVHVCNSRRRGLYSTYKSETLLKTYTLLLERISGPTPQKNFGIENVSRVLLRLLHESISGIFTREESLHVPSMLSRIILVVFVELGNIYIYIN